MMTLAGIDPNIIPQFVQAISNFLYILQLCTVQRKFLTEENIDEFDNFLAICQNFTIQNFLPTAVCMYVRLIQFIKILLVKIFLTPK